METVTEKTTIKNGGKPKDDPHIQLMKLTSVGFYCLAFFI